jgi:hypothetical protein
MSLTVTFTDAEAEILRQTAEDEQSTVEDVVRRALHAHLGSGRRSSEEGSPSSLLEDVDAARQDDQLVAVVDRIVERDAEILDRLAE